MRKFVVDASVVLAWCFPDESDTYANEVLRAVRTCQVIVPSLWHLELTNAFQVSERRGQTSPADTARAIAIIRAMRIQTDGQTAARAMADTLALCRSLTLTAYDAAYLELCIRENLPLATIDTNMAGASKTTGVARFEPNN